MSRPITPIQQAHLDTYAAACVLVPRNLRRKVILFGGAASIAHGRLSWERFGMGTGLIGYTTSFNE